MKITDLNNILFNPIFTANLLHHFLSGAKNNAIKYELIYLVLPILYNEKLLKRLNVMKNTSKISTFLSDDIQMEFIDLTTKVIDYKTKTNEAILLLSNKIPLDINTSITINSTDIISFTKEKDVILREYFKGAHYLGVIFSKENYISLFYKFK